MGFRPPLTVIELLFENDLAGLEISARSAELGSFLDMLKLVDKDEKDMSPDEVASLLTGFADVLVSWNVDHPVTGDPLPADLAGLRKLEFGFVLRLVQAWIGAIGDASDPLGLPSSGGRPSEVPSIPMEPLSTSRAS